MNIKEYIASEINRILDVNLSISVEVPPKSEMGDFSVQCASLRNENYNNPVEIAKIVKENFVDKENIFKNIVVMGPYLNFFLDNEKFNILVINDIENKKEKYGSLNQGRNDALLIEHTSINPNAEPHIGRCRNSLIGDFMSRLYSFTGYNVEKHYFINDLGKKIALLLIGIEKYGLKDDSFSSILDVYVKISNDEAHDETLSNKAFEYLELVENGNEDMIERFKNITDKCVEGQMKIFEDLGITFDVFTHESDYVYNNYLENILNSLREKGKLKEDELGRYYVDLSDYNIPTKEPVLVLTRSNKTSLYPIKDIAYTIYKINLNDKNNYIVLGEDQEVYMKQISAVMDILGYKSPKLISYSYVLLEGDKMSTSNGTVVLVTDFINEVNKVLLEEFDKRNTIVDDSKLRILRNACIKFTMLNVSKNKIVNFNLKNATSFNGESGIYILYSIVRINSILRNNGDVNLNGSLVFNNEIENTIIKELYRFPHIINELLTSNEPSHLTKYIFNLTQYFSKYYESINITKEEKQELKASRIRLVLCIKMVLTNALGILGIETVDKM